MTTAPPIYHDGVGAREHHVPRPGVVGLGMTGGSDSILLVEQALHLLDEGPATDRTMDQAPLGDSRTWDTWRRNAVRYLEKWRAGEGKTLAHP